MTNAIMPTQAQAVAVLTPAAERVKRYLEAREADNTKRAYRAHWQHFADFCAARSYTALPADVATVADYVTAQADTGAAVATITARLSAIRKQHENARLPNPTAEQAIRETMKGIRRARGTANTPKAALTLDKLKALLEGLPTDLRGIRDRALLLAGFGGAFRRSELVALTVADVEIEAVAMRLTVRRGKTDQEGRGFVKTIPTLPEPTLCPVVAMRAWLDAAGINSGIVFRGIDKWGHLHSGRMDGREVARITKAAAERAGLDPRGFAGHSLRRGFITEATRNGAQVLDIMELTGHRSTDTVKRYVESAGVGASRAARLAFGETHQ